MIEIGDLVKKTPDSDHIFRVDEIEDGVRTLLAPTGDIAEVPGSYPHWWPLRYLVPAGHE
ncbi:hypothetical protein BJY24_007900 [Nocardia transvalensis]|uniref:Uncharacterized protein n=1 Tax=Nocardia transvalensis TaxID=37333 RepID=A0A7W9PMS3_9NOCA|nr:hypothetical protein [Nocardia transvalensis]MBB5918967.1 hypothetical protein [Nocardia transvalensis]